MDTEVDHARVVPAPVIFFGLLILGFALNWVHPLAFFPRLTTQIVGIALVILGLLVGGSGIIEMRRARTTPDPREPTTALVEKGIFRYTRNPLYLSMFVLFLGIAVALNILWSILLVPLLFFGVERGAVKPEELYLERKFGDAYLQYKRRVPRWV